MTRPEDVVRGLSDDDKPPLLGRGFPAGLKIVLIIIVSVALMMIDSHYDRLAPVRSSLAVALQPLQIIAEMPTEALDYLTRFFDRDDLIARNETLSKQVLLLRARLQKLAALQAENARIRALLDSARHIEQEVLIAEILAVSPSPYQHYVTLNKGALDGVFVGQTLIDGNGIMGQIVSVTPMNSRAILITDANHAIPVVINRTGLRTIAEGTGKSGRLRLPFLPKSADVRVGDLLLTSGLGGGYPAGYPVATITHIKHPPGSQFLAVTAQPTAHLNHGSTVLLVWTHNNQHTSRQAPTSTSARATTGSERANTASTATHTAP